MGLYKRGLDSGCDEGVYVDLAQEAALDFLAEKGMAWVGSDSITFEVTGRRSLLLCKQDVFDRFGGYGFCTGFPRRRVLEATNLRGENTEDGNRELEEDCMYENLTEALSGCDAFYQMWDAGYPSANDSTCDAHDVYICINVE